MDGNSTTQPIHVVHPEEGTLFTCTDSKNKVAYQYIYGVSKWQKIVKIPFRNILDNRHYT